MTEIEQKVKELEKTVDGILASLRKGVDVTEEMKQFEDRVRKLEADLEELSKRIGEGRISPEAAEAKIETAEKKVDELAEEVKEAGETEPQSSSEAPAAESPVQLQTEEPAQPSVPEDDWPLGPSKKGIRLW